MPWMPPPPLSDGAPSWASPPPPRPAAGPVSGPPSELPPLDAPPLPVDAPAPAAPPAVAPPLPVLASGSSTKPGHRSSSSFVHWSKSMQPSLDEHFSSLAVTSLESHGAFEGRPPKPICATSPLQNALQSPTTCDSCGWQLSSFLQ